MKKSILLLLTIFIFNFAFSKDDNGHDGGNSGGGGFEYDNSLAILKRAQIELSQELSTVPLNVYQDYNTDDVKLNSIIQSAHLAPKEEFARSRSKGQKKEPLMMNYDLKTKSIEILQPFFEGYSVIGIEAQDLFITDIKRKLIHESLHISDNDQVKAADGADKILSHIIRLLNPQNPQDLQENPLIYFSTERHPEYFIDKQNLKIASKTEAAYLRVVRDIVRQLGYKVKDLKVDSDANVKSWNKNVSTIFRKRDRHGNIIKVRGTRNKTFYDYNWERAPRIEGLLDTSQKNDLKEIEMIEDFIPGGCANAWGDILSNSHSQSDFSAIFIELFENWVSLGIIESYEITFTNDQDCKNYYGNFDYKDAQTAMKIKFWLP